MFDPYSMPTLFHALQPILALMGVTLAPLVGELAAMEIVDGARVQLLEA